MASLVLGVLGLFCFAIPALILFILALTLMGGLTLDRATELTGRALLSAPLALGGLVLAFVSMRKIKKSGGLLTGRAIAWAGTIVSGLCLLVPVLMPNLVSFRKPAQKAACVANLKFIEGAKRGWALDMKKGDADVPTDADLFGRDKDVREKPTCPSGGSYTLGAVGEKPMCSNPDHVF